MVFTMAVTRLVLQRSFRGRRQPLQVGHLLAEATDPGVGAVVPTLPQLDTQATEGRPGGAAGASIRLVRPALHLRVAGA